MSTRWQHFFIPNSGSTCNQSLRECRLPGQWIRVEGAWENTQGLVSHHFFPTEASSSPLASRLSGHRSLVRCQGGCTLRKESWAGDPSTRRPGVWAIFCIPPSQRVGPLGFQFTRDSGPSRATQTVQVQEGSLWRAPCSAVSTPPPSSPGLSLLSYQDSDSILSQAGWKK